MDIRGGAGYAAADARQIPLFRLTWIFVSFEYADHAAGTVKCIFQCADVPAVAGRAVHPSEILCLGDFTLYNLESTTSDLRLEEQNEVILERNRLHPDQVCWLDLVTRLLRDLTPQRAKRRFTLFQQTTRGRPVHWSVVAPDKQDAPEIIKT